MHETVKPVRAVQRTLDILDRFLDGPGALGVGEVSRLTRIPKSTAYRLLLTLEANGYLERRDGEKFLLGARLRPQGRRAPDLRAAAQSVIEGLRDTCGETVGLHQLDGDERVCVGAAEGSRTLRTSARIGSRAPLYSGASARAIMAFLPEDRQEAMIAAGLRPITARTITDPAQLRAELARIREVGWAASHGEWEEEITSVAAPLFGPGGAVVGSVNISGPSFRFSEEKLGLLAGALKAAAAVITQRLQPGGERA